MKNVAFATNNEPITIYGASDDLVEVEGGIREEFNYDGYLHFSDGTVIHAVYNADGIWRLRRTKKGTANYQHKRCDGDNDDDYTDKVILTGTIESVAFWPKEKPDKESLCEVLGDVDWEDYSKDTLLQVHRLLALRQGE